MKKRITITCDSCGARGARGQGEFSSLAPLPEFTPVPRKTKRHDGWTPVRQRAFIEALAATGSVRQAAEGVNMSSESAYQLRLHPEAGSFREAWDEALSLGGTVIEAAAMDRAINGVPVPYYHHGEQVGERRVFNERLTMWLLQNRKPERYGPAPQDGLTAEEMEHSEHLRARIDRYGDEWVDRIANLYGQRLLMERRARLEGDVVAADLYLRQLTHMEILLEVGGGGKYLLALANGGNGSGDHRWNMGKEIVSTPITERLDSIRRRIWAQAGEPARPLLSRNRALDHNAVHGGEGFEERKALLKDAQARAGKAQLMLEQALYDHARATHDPDTPPPEPPQEPEQLPALTREQVNHWLGEQLLILFGAILLDGQARAEIDAAFQGARERKCIEKSA